MTEEKKGVLTIDAADIAEKTLSGISGVVPVLEKHPKGTLALLLLLTLGAGTAIAILTITRQPPTPEKKEPPQASESGAVKHIDGEDGEDKTWGVKN